MTDAYAEWFSIMTRTPAPGTLPWDSGEVRRLAEQWRAQRVVIGQRIVLLTAPCCVPPLDNGGDVF
jgi:hypothetical protein